MPEQRNIPVFRPGAGDVANGSVDYYPMDWEIVGREDQPAAGRARGGCGCAQEAAVPEAPAAPAPSQDGRPQQAGNAGGYDDEMVTE